MKSFNLFDDISLRHSLKTKIIILICSFIIITATALSILYTTTGNNVLLEQNNRLKVLQEKLQVQELFRSINTAHRDIAISTQDPDLLQLIHLLQQTPNVKTTERLKQKLQKRYFASVSATPDYMQYRLIDVTNGGNEIIRIDRDNQAVIAIPANKLQNKSNRDYYREILKLRPGEFYTSKINLNREHGKIETPYKPTIRIAKPIFDSSDKIAAFIIININLKNAFSAIRKIADNMSTLYIVNENGDYLLNPNPSKDFAFDFGRRENFKDDFPELSNLLNSSNDDYIGKLVSINKKEEYIYFIRLATNTELGNNRIYAIQFTPRDELLNIISQTTLTGHIIAIGITFLSIFISLLLSRKLLAPIHKLIMAVKNFTKGNPEKISFPEDRPDEVGLLSQSFKQMLNTIEQRETAIYDEQARYKAIFSNSRDGIVITNKNTEIEESNEAFLKIFGDKNENLINKKLSDLIRPSPSHVNFYKKSDTRFSLNNFCNGNCILTSNDGQEIPVLVSSSVFHTKSDKRYAIQIHDLRQQLSAEDERLTLMMQLKQAQKLEAVGLLSSGIAHDFNNILGVVSGYTELLLLHKDIDQKSKEQYLNDILISSDKAKEMIKNLMSYCRSDNTINHTDNTQESLFEIILLLEHALPSNIIFSHDVNSDIENLAIDIAPYQLQQIILNLCINARDAIMGKGKIHIDARISRETVHPCSSCEHKFEGEFLYIAIVDDGPGIKSEDIQKLFQPLYSTKPKGEGTGLGLYMVNSIIHDAYGHIVVVTGPRSGTSFQLYIPISNSDIIDDDNLDEVSNA